MLGLFEAHRQRREERPVEDGVAGLVLDVGHENPVPRREGERGLRPRDPEKGAGRKEKERDSRGEDPPEPAAPGGLRDRRRGRRREGGAGRPARERREIGGEIAGGVIAALGLLGEAAADDPAQLRRELRQAHLQGRRLPREDRGHGVGLAPPAERPRSREHLVEDYAEREDVRPRIKGLSPDLLGRHVGGRPDDDARLGHDDFGRGFGVHGCGRRLLGDAEVQDLHPAVAGQEEVLRLQVPVDDSLLVRRREAGGDLGAAVARPADRERPVAEALAQRLALQQLHDEDVARAGNGIGRRRRRSGDFFE